MKKTYSLLLIACALLAVIAFTAWRTTANAVWYGAFAHPSSTILIAATPAFDQELYSWAIEPLLSEDLRFLKEVNRYVYQEASSQADLFVAAPLLSSKRVQERVEDSGFTTWRIGPYMYGSTQPISRLDILKRAVRQLPSALFQANPIAQGRLSASHSPLGKDISFAADTESEAEEIRAIISFIEGQKAIKALESSGEVPDGENSLPTLPASAFTPDTSVVIPVATLDHLRPQQVEQLNQFLAQAFGFTHTVPDFISDIKRTGGQVGLVLERQSTETAGLALRFSPAAAGLVEQWINDEVAHHHPTSQAFRLPDGTIGREVVPDHTQANLSLAHITSGCTEHKQENPRLIICVEGGVLAVATSRPLADQLLVLAPSSFDWQLRIAGGEKERLPLLNSDKWHVFTGYQQAGKIHLTLRP